MYGTISSLSLDLLKFFACFSCFVRPQWGKELSMALTKRQKEVLDFISGFVDENGYCPSFEEIARGLEQAVHGGGEAGESDRTLTGTARR